MTDRTRPALLVDLADAVNQLTRPRQHTEILEASVTRTVTSRSGKIRAKRTRERRRHTITLPPLLDELRTAAVPGAGDTAGAASGGFESRPSAELEPISVLREIVDDAGFWARTFAIEEPTLAGVLHALVSAAHDDTQLARIVTQARRWVHRARLATGHEPPPVTIAAPCVYCNRRNSIVITGDLTAAHCSQCGVRWSPDTIGLLADMLRANQHQETLALPRCWQHECARYGDHDEHSDGHGRTWRDTCPVDPGDPRRAVS